MHDGVFVQVIDLTVTKLSALDASVSFDSLMSFFTMQLEVCFFIS